MFLAVGLSFAAMTYAVVREFRRRRSQPLHERRPVAVGGAVVPFDRVRFARKLQIGSSSPELVAVTPCGTHVLKRGNPFDGGIGNVDEIRDARTGCDLAVQAPTTLPTLPGSQA